MYHWKIWGSAHRDCNIKVKLNPKTSVKFHNLKNYHAHLIMQKLSKFNYKLNVIPNGFEKYMGFNINHKLDFTERFQYLSSWLDSLVKRLGKDDLKYLSQEFDRDVLDLVKQKDFILMSIWVILKSSKKNCQAKKSFVVR